MKNLRKIIAVLIGASMLLSLMPAALASTEDAHKYAGELFAVDNSANTANTYAFTDGDAHTGDISLHLTHAGDNTDALKFSAANNESTLLTSGWSYTWYYNIKFYTKGTLPENMTMQIKTTNGKVDQTISMKTGEVTVTTGDSGKAEGWTVSEPDENGWQMHKIANWNVDPAGTSGGGRNEFHLTISEGADFYLDDFNVDIEARKSNGVKDDASSYTNWLNNYDPSFENILRSTSSEKTNIRSLIYDATTSSIQLTWKNPNRSDITAFKILQDGTDITGSATFVLTKCAINKFDVSGLTSNKGYDYTVVMTAGGQEITKTITAYTYTRSNSRYTHDRYPIGSGRYLGTESATTDGTGYSANVNLYIDFDEKASGNSSLKVVSNNQSKANQFMRIAYPNCLSATDSGSSYTVSFKGKAVEAEGLKVSASIGNAYSGYATQTIGEAGYFTNTDWTDYTLTLTAGSNTTFYLKFENSCGAFYIDDLKVIKTDDTTNTNLVENGGFEYEVTSVSFDEATKTLSWIADAADTGWDGYKILKVDPRTGSLNEIASYAMADLTSGNTYVDDDALSANNMYAVKTFYDTASGSSTSWTSKGVASSDWDVTAPAFDAVSFADGVEFSKLGEGATVIGEVSSIDAEGGNYMVSVGVNNEENESNLGISFFAVLYKNDMLADLVRLESTVLSGDAPSVFKGVLNVPAKGEDTYKIKTFVWSGDDGMTPLMEAGSIANAQ